MNRDAIKSLRERIVMLQTLMDQEGWRLFMEGVIKPTYESAITKATDARDQFEAAKHLGVARMARDLSTWAEREIQVAQLNIKELEREETY